MNGKDLIVDRIAQGLCPVCGKVPQSPAHRVKDANLFFKGDPKAEEYILICSNHIVEVQ